jgi:tRNA(Arg) A34 adenosine deaminase TadA
MDRPDEVVIGMSGDAVWEPSMRLALDEAATSLREGNNGFGALVVHDGKVIAIGHDTEETERDPTAHAELAVVRRASRARGGRLDGCTLVSTHEPCPMCATAVVWAGVPDLVYGCSIEDAVRQGRRRIVLGCAELFERAGAEITVREGVLRDECATLYNGAVRAEVARLRGATAADLDELQEALSGRRRAWCADRPSRAEEGTEDPLAAAYELFLDKLGLEPDEAPVASRTPDRLVVHSRNFCPTLEACKLLQLDTRVTCRAVTEKPADVLVKHVDPRLTFSRNYTRLRPYASVCEEIIAIIP